MDFMPPIAQRGMRIQTAVSLREPDRVPFVPTFNNFYQLGYGVSFGDSMRDVSTLDGALDAVLDRFEPDLINLPTVFPAPAMERAVSTCCRFPGKLYNLGDDVPYQYIDKQFVTDEDFDDFLRDPSWFLFQKVLPQKYAAFGPLAMLNPNAMMNSVIYSLAAFGAPPMQATLQAMMDTGKLIMDNLDKCAAQAMHAVERGFIPFGGATCMCPFDEYADHIRGIMEACMDCIEEPERLEKALEICERHIPAFINTAKMQHAKYVFVPLHCGVDDFMSLENYKRFYWPGLKKVIEAIIAEDMTPLVICEGKYRTRLEVLADVPKGKVIYFFEDVDLVKAKEILGGVACIAGGMPTEYLMFGDKQRVIDHTKRMIDTLAPGGGYIMSNSLALDQVKMENMEAWKDTVFSYGKYMK